QKVNQLGLVIRDLEDYLVHQLLESHTREWYIDKITTFSKKGGMSEKQFYDLIGYKYPGENKVFIGEQLTTERHFGASLKQESAEVL
ncbi:hypothetical protein, partial [Klebsiella pneumoniae]|uniref:hypothetical protein n=1 Tax=Klebsiella pneumoniae TaxID=573 RepID=UPI003EE0FA97